MDIILCTFVFVKFARLQVSKSIFFLPIRMLQFLVQFQESEPKHVVLLGRHALESAHPLFQTRMERFDVLGVVNRFRQMRSSRQNFVRQALHFSEFLVMNALSVHSKEEDAICPPMTLSISSALMRPRPPIWQIILPLRS